MKWTFKRIISQIFLTHMGRILLAGLLLIVGGIMSPNGTIGEYIYDYDKGIIWTYMAYVGAATLMIETLISITYGWVINPIRKYKARK